MSGKHVRQNFLFIGNRLCLDFVNTQLVGRAGAIDLLRRFEDLVAWLEDSGTLAPVAARAARQIQVAATRKPGLLREALELRAALRLMLDRIVSGRPAPVPVLDTLNRILRSRATYDRLVRAGNRFERRPEPIQGGSLQILAPVADSAGKLLCEDDLSLVRRCANPRCILYFYDTTKNGARRWCSMQVCGNRMKVASHSMRGRALRGN